MMGKRFIILVLSLLFYNVVAAQTTVRGIVMMINSSYEPVSGVSVVASGTSPVVTDNSGTFRLILPYAEPGDLMMNIRIKKNGYEIVNDKEIKEWIVSEDIIYKVILCPEGYLEANRRKYYEIGINIYQTRYEENLKKINKLKEENKVSIEEYERELAGINEEYRKAMSLLDYYSSRFARINKDELSDMEKQAMTFLEAGDIDGAIKVYEDSHIYENFVEKLGQRDSAGLAADKVRQMIENKIELYYIEGTEEAKAKADSLRLFLEQPNGLKVRMRK